VTGCVGEIVAGGIRGRLRRWIAEALLAFLSVWTGAERTEAGAGLAGFYPSLPGDGPDPLAATRAGRAWGGDHRRTLTAGRVFDVALVAWRPGWICTCAVGTAIRIRDDPGQASADTNDRLPLASATNSPAIGTTALRPGRGGCRPGLGAARMTWRVRAGSRASRTGSARAACR
jgi:hypothetical protein